MCSVIVIVDVVNTCLVVAAGRLAILQRFVTLRMETGVGLRVVTRINGLGRYIIVCEGTVLSTLFFYGCFLLAVDVGLLYAFYL